MKSSLIGLMLLTCSFSGFAQSIGVGTSVEEFRQNLKESLDQTKSDMELQVSRRNLAFPDYKDASQDLLAQINESSETFVKNLNGVENFLAWYDSVRDARSSDRNNRAIERLLEKKKTEMEKLREDYKIYAQKFVMLNGLLSFPVSTKIGANETPMLLIVPTIAGQLDYLLTKGALDMYKNLLFVRDAFEGQLPYKVLKQRAFGASAINIFSKCKTQGCVYYIAEDIAEWIAKSHKMAAKLNIPVENVKEFKSSKIASFSKIQKSLDAIADIAADGKPTSL